MRRLVSLLIAVTTLSLARTAVAQDGKPEFSITIHGPQSVKAGAYLMVDILVTNVSDHVIAFDGEQNYQVDVFDAEGNFAPRTWFGRARRGEKPAPGDPEIIFTDHGIQRNLKPGETVKESVGLNGPVGPYDLKPGRYTVSISRDDFQQPAHTPIDYTKYKPEDASLYKPHPPQVGTMTNPPALKPKAIAKSNTITIAVVE